MQLIIGLLVCLISACLYSKFAPYIEDDDDTLSQVCQVSLFFALISCIALRLEPTSSSDTIAWFLVGGLLLPLVVVVIVEAHVDVAKMLGLRAIARCARRLFEATAGRCLLWLFRARPPTRDVASPTSAPQAPTERAPRRYGAPLPPSMASERTESIRAARPMELEREFELGRSSAALHDSPVASSTRRVHPE